MEFIIGMFVGGLMFWLFFERKKLSGKFVIDFTDPLKDICRLELDEDINRIATRKQMTLKVELHELDSQN